MTLGFAIIILAVLAMLVACYGHGYPNTVDAISYWLHLHAKAVREMQDQRTAVVKENWVKELEKQ